jgi:hypothetical protein
MLLVFVLPDGISLLLWPVNVLVDLALAFVGIWV